MSKSSLNSDGLVIPQQDLGAISPSADDDARLYNHDGSSTITLFDGSTSSNKGYYQWDNIAGAWRALKSTVTNADLLDNLDSTDFIQADGSVTMTGNLEFDSTVYRAIRNINEIASESGRNLNVITNGDSLYVFDSTGGLQLFAVQPSGNVDVPNGQLSEQGTRVATLAALLGDFTDVVVDTLVNQPAAGTAGRWHLTTDNNGIYYDDGTAWQLIAEHPGNIAAADLGFDPATQSELDTVSSNLSSHESDTTNPHSVTATQAGAPTQSEFDTHTGDESHGEPFGVSLTHAEWEDALSNEEVYRCFIPSGMTLYLQRVEARQKSGGSSSFFELDVYDVTNATVLGSTTLGGASSGDPLASVAGGVTIIVRVSNSSGGPLTASLNVTGYMN